MHAGARSQKSMQAGDSLLIEAPALASGQSTIVIYNALLDFVMITCDKCSYTQYVRPSLALLCSGLNAVERDPLPCGHPGC